MKIKTPFSLESAAEKEKQPPNSAQLTDVQKATMAISDNIIIAKAPGEELIPGPDNTYISLGRDRPGEIGSGNPYTSAGAIYICAGASHGMPDKTPKGQDGEDQKAQRNFNIDASTIYMSAECNIDDYFGITAGAMGRPKNSAGIAIKSTNLRLVARNGIKLVTRTDPKNENLAPLSTSIVGIELIAGNDSSGLEPIVKGNALTAAMDDLTQIVIDICDTLEHFIKHQSDFNAVLASHTHPDILNILIGLIVLGDPMALTDGKSLEDMKTKIQGEITTSFMVGSMMPDMQKHKTNIQNWFIQYALPQGGDYFGSRYNKVN